MNNPVTKEQFKQDVVNLSKKIAQMLITKNENYGNSIFEGKSVFSKEGSYIDKICLRIDDKLERIKKVGFDGEDEDTLLDLIGYLIILKIGLDNDNSKKVGNNE